MASENSNIATNWRPVYDLHDRVAVVTGGASGIGEACVEVLVACGARVVIADRDGAAAQEVANHLPPGQCLTFEVDVSDPVAVDSMVDFAVTRFGGLDVAVNNAGVSGPAQRLDRYTDDDWRSVLAVNLDGVFYSVRAEIRAFLAAGRSGSIVNVASVLGVVAARHSGAYIAAKHGLVGLTRACAVEYADDGIRVNAVAPGFISTPMLESHVDPRTRAALARRHPLGRLGTSREVASLVGWLLTDHASFVTGSLFPVDGGYLTV